MAKFIDLTGQKFGRLTVIKRIENIGRFIAFLCKCECGNIKGIRSSDLKTNVTKSCGCLRAERVVKRNFKHGLKYHPLYNKLSGMIQRCENPNYTFYKTYGGRGISICKEWRTNTKCFVEWCLKTGWKKGLSLDRIDNDGNYEPSNCQWLTKSENTIKSHKERKAS